MATRQSAAGARGIDIVVLRHILYSGSGVDRFTNICAARETTSRHGTTARFQPPSHLRSPGVDDSCPPGIACVSKRNTKAEGQEAAFAFLPVLYLKANPCIGVVPLAFSFRVECGLWRWSHLPVMWSTARNHVKPLESVSVHLQHFWNTILDPTYF